MEKIVFVLALIALMVVGQETASGQTTRHEKNQLALLEAEISKLEKEILQEERSLAREKHGVQYQLRQQVRRLEIQADPRRAQSIAQVDWAKAELERVKLQIDSVGRVSSTPEIEKLKGDLAQLEEQRVEMIQGFLSPDYSVPREMGVVTKKRRQRANVIRREELVLSKIENNIGGPAAAINPNNDQAGYKVIFDNKYSLSTTFVLQPLNGSERLAVSLSPRSKETHYLLPGVYLVEFYVNGARADYLTSRLTVDGTRHYYEGEPCFGFAYKSR